MFNPNELFTLNEVQQTQADKMEALITKAVEKQHADDPNVKAFTFKTAEISKEIGGLDIKTRTHVIDNHVDAGWKVKFDGKKGELVLTAKRPRKANKPKVETPAAPAEVTA